MVKVRSVAAPRDQRLEAETTLIAPSADLTRSAAFQEAFETAPGPSLFRFARRQNDIRDVLGAIAGDAAALDRLPADQITREEANERYGADGLDFTKFGAGPLITEREAIEMQAIKQRENFRRFVLSENTSLGAAGRFAAAAGGTFADPLTLASAFIPAAWIGRAGQFARGGAALRAASRAGAGAAEGFAFGVGAEAIVLPVAQSEGRDYDLGDSIAAVFFSTVLGGAFAPAFGAVADAIGGVPGAARGGRAAGDIEPDAPRDLADIPALRDPEEINPILRRHADAQQAAIERAVRRPIDEKAAGVRSEFYAKAMDDIAGDGDVDLGPLIRKIAREEGIDAPSRPPSADAPEALPRAIDEAAPSRPFAQIADEAGEAAPVKLGEGTPDDQIAALRADPELADARARLDEEIAAGRISEAEIEAARAEVRAALGVETRGLAAEETEAAFTAAVNCALGR